MNVNDVSILKYCNCIQLLDFKYLFIPSLSLPPNNKSSSLFPVFAITLCHPISVRSFFRSKVVTDNELPQHVSSVSPSRYVPH
ncbi:hypothetical protein RJT34_30926 [Clitoria ternatea]|uniref:Uncharacterized protein n=1 Tax=Clitoria ternatea TaxID=43366 RepID=A0AAN9EUB7_CLITE